MNRSRFFWRGGALALAICLFCAACANGPDSTAQPSPAPSAAAAQPVRMYLPRDCGPLDPLFPQTAQVLQALSLVFDPLVTLAEDGQAQPNLAQSWKSAPQEDGSCVWTLTLTPDAAFAPYGDPLTAADVVFTLGVIMGSRTDSPYRPALARYVRAEAADERTVAITAANASPLFLRALAFPVVSAAHYGEDALPAGTGPYRATAFEALTQLTLTANDGWWRTAPTIKTVEFKCYADDSTALTAFSAGELDAMTTRLRTAAARVNTPGLSAAFALTQTYECAIPNHKNAILGNDTVRQALRRALDPKALIDRAYCGLVLPCEVPLPPGDVLATPLTPPLASVLEASALLAEDGWSLRADGVREKNGVVLAFAITVAEDSLHPERVDAAYELARQWGEIGAKVTVQTLPPDTVKKRVNEGNFDLFYTAYELSRIPDWAFFLASGAQQNVGRYSNAALDTALDELKTAPDTTAAAAALSRLCGLFAADWPLLGIGFRQGLLLSDDRLSMPRANRLESLGFLCEAVWT